MTVRAVGAGEEGEMADVVVVGGGVVGLCGGLLLARDGHRVRLLERDPASPPSSPDDAWFGWERRGVNQFRMLHYFLPRFREILDAQLPDVAAALDAAGALRSNVIDSLPAQVTGGSRPGDERFTALTGRRPVVESPSPGWRAASRGSRSGGGRRSGDSGPPSSPGAPASPASSASSPTSARRWPPTSSSTRAVGARRSRNGSPPPAPARRRRSGRTRASCTTAATSDRTTGRCPRRSVRRSSPTIRCRSCCCPPTTGRGAWA